MTEDNYKFMEEKIKPHKKRLIKEALVKLTKLAISGVVFGGVAAVTGMLVISVSGATNKDNRDNDVSEALYSPTLAPTYVPCEEEPDSQESGEEGAGYNFNDFTVAEYETVKGKMAEFAEAYNDTIVTVAKVTQGMDCFENPVESSDSFGGLVIRVDNDNIYILTEYDGLKDNSAYRIYFRNGEYSKANVLGVDRVTGLAVISASLGELSEEIPKSVRKAVLGYSSKINVGDVVVAIGNPAGSMYSMSHGVVLTNPITKYITDRQVLLYHTDLPYVDNGGGIVMDYRGSVVGILTHKFSAEYGDITSFMGISELSGLINSLICKHNMSYMGIKACNMTEEYKKENKIKDGIYITSIEHGSPAENANLAVGDIIVKIDGEHVSDVFKYSDIISRYNDGDKAEVTIVRPYARKDVDRTVEVVMKEAVRGY